VSATRHIAIRHTALSRRLVATAALTLTVVLAAASPVAAHAPDWTGRVNVRAADDVQLRDADFSRRNVAITWQEPGAGGPKVGLRTSVDSGASFGPISWVNKSRQSAVDICGGSELNAVYAKKVSSGNWRIDHAVGSIDGDGFLRTPVSLAPGVNGYPDVACAGGRVFVSWFQRDGGGDRLKLAHGIRNDGAFETPMTLGFDDETFFGRSLAVAGTSDTAYAVFTKSSGDLRFRSWSIGSGPGFAVTPQATRIIGPASRENSADGAVIAAAGSKVAVAWFKCGGIFARVSNDRGQTWGPVRKVLEHMACDGDFGASQRSIAIRGNRIVISYLAFGIPNVSITGLIRTTNDFATSTDDVITFANRDEHLLGYVTVGGTTRLAAAFDTGDCIRFRRQE